MPEATSELLIPHHEILELLKHVPGYEDLTIEHKESRVLSWGSGQAGGYTLADPKDYPGIPEVKVGTEGELDGDMLTTNLLAMVTYCATEESRPVLCGVAVYLGDKVALAAGDGFRMGYHTLPLSFPAERTISLNSSSLATFATYPTHLTQAVLALAGWMLPERSLGSPGID